jgi:hypothetical protein
MLLALPAGVTVEVVVVLVVVVAVLLYFDFLGGAPVTTGANR